MSTKEKAVKGVLWSSFERFSTQGIQFVLILIIARLLSPSDYGLVAMLGVFISISQTIVDSGFSKALIQKKDRTEVDYNTVFYSNFLLSIGIYALLFILAPLVADFYNQPALIKILRVSGLALITNSLGIIQQTRLTIDLNFRKLAFSGLSSVIVSGCVGLWMAHHGYGVWTLVFQTLTASTVWCASLWIASCWMPKICFSWTSFRTLSSFGFKIMFSGLLHTLYLNMYSLVIGKFFSASALGYFNRAYTLGQFPVQNFGSIVQKVIYPIQCRNQDDDVKFNQIFTIHLRLSSFILFPLMIGLAVLAAPILQLLLTTKWLPAAPYLQIMCLSMMWFPIMQANVQLLDAKGRSDLHLKSEVIKKVLAVLILAATIPLGLSYVCWGMLLYSFVDMAVIIFYSRRFVSVGYRAQLRILLPAFVLSLCMGAVVWGTSSLFELLYLKVVLGSFVGLSFYATFAYLLKFPEIELILSFLKKKKGDDNHSLVI